MDLKERIRTALAAHRRTTLPPGPTPAAVLFPLYPEGNDYHVLLTKRTTHLNHHRGEISFPGGVRHQDDRTLLGTALRETWEEVGIEPGDVEILGMLDDIYSVHNYLVTPFVGTFPADYPLKLNPREIDKILCPPLIHLRDPEVFRIEDWTWRGRSQPVHFYRYGEDEIWGLTAAILSQFLDIVFGEHNVSQHPDRR